MSDRLTMRKEVEDLQVLLENRMGSPIQFSLYATLINQYKYPVSREIVPNFEPALFRAHNKRLSDNRDKILTWVLGTPKSLIKSTHKLAKMMDRSLGAKRELNARELAAMCAFFRDLDMLILGINYLVQQDIKHDAFPTACVQAFECVEWFCENIWDMGTTCRFYMYGTDPFYTKDASILRSKMAGAMDDVFATMAAPIMSQENFDKALDKIFKRFGAIFDATAEGLGVDVRWKGVEEDRQHLCFEEDESLFNLFNQMDNCEEKDVESYMTAAICYCALTTQEIITDEMDPNDAYVAQLQEVYDTILLSLDASSLEVK